MTEPGGGRDELSRTLRALRAVARLSQAEAGRRAGIGQHAVSRFERGLYVPSPDEAAVLAGVYRAPEDTAERLRQLAEDLRAETVPARVVLQRGAASFQQRIGRIEAAAAHIRTFEPAMVIGLLQSPAYMRLVFGQRQRGLEAQEAVEARLERRRILDDPHRRFTLIQTEGSLRWLLGSPELMAEQLDLVAAGAGRGDHVRVGFIPWTTPARVLATHGFQLYDRRAATVGTKTATAIMTEEHDVATYDELFGRLETLAVFGHEAADHCHRIADEYRDLACSRAPSARDVPGT